MTPQELRRHYERCLARARGASAAGVLGARDPEAAAFADWMAQFWMKTCPVAPALPPDAISAGVGGADEMRWCAAGDTILAYVADYPDGCYRIPCEVEPPGVTTPRRAPSGSG
jgi:hypothetical protein